MMNSQQSVKSVVRTMAAALVVCSHTLFAAEEIPDGYLRLKYLQGDGLAYIDLVVTNGAAFRSVYDRDADRTYEQTTLVSRSFTTPGNIYLFESSV